MTTMIISTIALCILFTITVIAGEKKNPIKISNCSKDAIHKMPEYTDWLKI